MCRLAIPVDAVTAVLRSPLRHQRMISLRRNDFPVPAEPVKNMLCPALTLSRIACCSSDRATLKPSGSCYKMYKGYRITKVGVRTISNASSTVF